MILLRRKKIKKLVLTGKNLDAFPSEVFEDKSITTLDLSNNHIKEIPANISELKKLRFLYLRNNDISQLHSGILKLESLRCLYLFGNPMKSLPDFIKEKAQFSIYTDNEVHLYYPEITIDGDKKALLSEIKSEVEGIKGHETEFVESSSVPVIDDDGLKFSRQDNRLGKTIETSVLFVDIRDSVQKNEDHRVSVLAKMYTAFTYGVLRIAKEYNGHVRNIIGDRVMVVFDKENCCDNAVRCAGSILYFCKTAMTGILPNDSFRCGIGIHYGRMNVIKVGLIKQDKENNDYKNMVWIGEPANLASRLTDMAGKKNIPSIMISRDIFKGINSSLKKHFTSVDKKKFMNIDFDVLGSNLLIK